MQISCAHGAKLSSQRLGFQALGGYLPAQLCHMLAAVSSSVSRTPSQQTPGAGTLHCSHYQPKFNYVIKGLSSYMKLNGIDLDKEQRPVKPAGSVTHRPNNKKN